MAIQCGKWRCNPQFKWESICQKAILNIYDINRFRLTFFTAQYINHNLPVTFDGFLNFRSQIYNDQTRQCGNLHIPLLRTSLAQMSVKFKCVTVSSPLSEEFYFLFSDLQI